jgi:hydroxymethylpyrimidine kinase/phosphomethylpyrimidine kinase
VAVNKKGRPDVLICSGLDPSGGAGFLVDARVVAELGGRPVGVVTAMTVQDTLGMRACHPVDPEVIGAQLNALLTDVEVRAVKLGLLGSLAIVRELSDNLALTRAPVVWDPVLAPSRGNLTFAEIIGDALTRLGPHLTLVTPNRAELAALTGRTIDSLDDAIAAAQAFHDAHRVAVLVKGGHLESSEAVDVLCHEHGIEQLTGPRLATEDVHGTGCALSSAIACLLATGVLLPDACRVAKQYIADWIANPARPGRGAPAIA